MPFLYGVEENREDLSFFFRFSDILIIENIVSGARILDHDSVYDVDDPLCITTFPVPASDLYHTLCVRSVSNVIKYTK